MPVPYTFATASTTIPLSQLDANFQTPITIGQTNANLGQVVTTIFGLTLTNVNITSGNVTISNITVTNVTTGNAVITGGTISNTTLTNVAITSLSTPLPNNLLANSSVTIGNTSVALGSTIGNIGNLTLTNTTISSVATTFPNNFLSNNSLTIGNTTIALGSTTANIGNVTFANVIVQSGNVTGAIPTTTIGNTVVIFGGTVSALGNIALNNVTVNSVSTAITAAQGGTGLVTLPANNVLVGNGTGSVVSIAPGSINNVLTSNGTAWISAAAGALAGNVTYGNTTVNLGSSSSSIGNLTLNNVTIASGNATLTNLNSPTGVLASQNGMVGIAKAWVNYNAVTKTVNNSFNISSVTYSSTGNYILNFITPMPNAYYAAAGMAWDNINAIRVVGYNATPTTTTCGIICALPNTYAGFDSNNMTVIILGS